MMIQGPQMLRSCMIGWHSRRLVDFRYDSQYVYFSPTGEIMIILLGVADGIWTVIGSGS